MGQLRIVDSAPSGSATDTWLQDAGTSSPADGGWVHAVTDHGPGPGSGGAVPVWSGMIYQLDAAESFSKGANLATNGSGEVRTAASGDVKVAEALEASSGSSDTVWVVAAPQRTV